MFLSCFDALRAVHTFVSTQTSAHLARHCSQATLTRVEIDVNDYDTKSATKMEESSLINLRLNHECQKSSKSLTGTNC